MIRRLSAAVGAAFLAGVAICAEPELPQATRTATAVQCVENLGAGVKTRRTFCDVLIGTKPGDSVSIAIPARTGAATLQFDLHNRFVMPAVVVPGPLGFAKHDALAAVVREDGQVLGNVGVAGEFRTPADLFDQIGGGGRPGGVKAVAPGRVESVRMSIPAGVSTVGVIGIRLKVLTRTGEESFDSPGRPVAIVSNLRVQYRAAR